MFDSRRLSTSFLTVLVPPVLAVGLVRAGGLPFGTETGGAGMGPSVEHEPVVVSGEVVPERAGAAIADLALFRWDGVEFVGVPFQIDERVEHVFGAGGPLEFVQNIHDIWNEEDGTLDGDDELVFLFESAGARAPADAAWPQGSDGLMHELRVGDATGEVGEPRWLYLFGGAGPAPTVEPSVQWDVDRTSAIETELYTMDFVDRWLLLGVRVKPPCGDGGDLIDRLKGRAGLAVDRAESEQLWNATAFYMGGILGPVRAIRYIRGAASGLNTVHHDIIYAHVWERDIQLRVHPLDNVWMYLDWLPGRVETLFSPSEPEGVAIDGDPDSVATSIQPWELVRGPNGGLALLYDVPPSPFIGESSRYYRDDESFDDAPLYPPDYDDEDDASIGALGIHLHEIYGQETDTIHARMRIYPLCGDVGDATVGAGYRALWDLPPTVTATARWGEIAPVRDLEVGLDGLDVVLAWDAVDGAGSYRVYAGDDVAAPVETWDRVADQTGAGFVDAGAAGPSGLRAYTVTVVTAGGEEIP